MTELTPEALAEEERREAAFLAALEAQLAAQRTDPAAGAQAAQQIMEAVDAQVRKRWGTAPWVRRSTLGTVQSVDTAKRRTRTAMAPEGAGAASAQTVKYGVGTAQPRKKYVVAVPVRLPDPPTPLITGPVPAGEPWLKAPAGQRWLYGKQGSTLYRWTWPPPGEEPWLAETVHTGLERAWSLHGASTPPGEATQIVLEQVTGTGAEDDPVIASRFSTLHHLDAMGFGDLNHEYALSPPYVRSGGIANDGITVAASNERGIAAPIPAWHLVEKIVYVPDGAQQSCCIDFPVEGGPTVHSCVFIDNFKPEFIFKDVPQPPSHRLLGFGLWQGQPADAPPVPPPFGVMTRKVNLAETWRIYDEVQRTSALKQTCTGSGCHVISGFLIGWDTYNCVTTLVYSEDIHTYFFVYNAPLYADVAAWGAWEYDGTPATGYSWRVENAVIPVQLDRQSYVNPDTEMPLVVQGVGCSPAGPTIIHAGGPNAQTLAMALAPADRELIVWFQTIRTAPTVVQAFYRWTHGTKTSISPMSRFYALSRDGTDALIEQSPGQYAYTLDGGDTWATCRNPLATIGGGAQYKLVDELG